MALPGATRQFVELLPISFVPRIHRLIQTAALNWMLTLALRFIHTPSRVISNLPPNLRKYLLVYPKPPRMKEFLGLLYQTRQPAECFGGKERGKASAEGRGRELR
jgi:hypothetical protein